MTESKVTIISIGPADMAWDQDVAGLGVSAEDQRLIDLLAASVLITPQGVRELMASAHCEREWRKLKNAVRAAHSPETFKRFWQDTIVMTGDSVKIRARWKTATLRLVKG